MQMITENLFVTLSAQPSVRKSRRAGYRKLLNSARLGTQRFIQKSCADEIEIKKGRKEGCKKSVKEKWHWMLFIF